MENLTIENTIIVIQAMIKVLTFFWPLLFCGMAMMLWSKEKAR
tara:strand:+ start:1160 stop:1288 length:129 start_codon:yes stop_codon:yes gene_type:complete